MEVNGGRAASRPPSRHRVFAGHEMTMSLNTRSFMVALLAGLLATCTTSNPGRSQGSPTATATSPPVTASPTLSMPAATPTPSTSPAVTTATATIAVARKPEGYVLPSECSYVSDGSTEGASTKWLIRCPVGLPSNYLRPSLTQQGWVSCSAAPKSWIRAQLLIVITDFVNRTDASGEIEQKAASSATC